ncbi:MAG: acyl-CoA desaturase [Planctomycetota bacterium]
MTASIPSRVPGPPRLRAGGAEYTSPDEAHPSESASAKAPRREAERAEIGPASQHSSEVEPTVNAAAMADAADPDDVKHRIRTIDVIPFAMTHLLCFGIIWVGWSWTAVSVAVFLYLLRMFVITGFYHRYFSHRSFKTYRWVAFLFGFIGITSAQRGPIWWASHHREHHRHSDEEPDIHSPHIHGMLWSHMGWFLSIPGRQTCRKAVPDLLKLPEIQFLDRFHLIGPIVLGFGMFGLGWMLERFIPTLGTNGWQMVIWGYAVSTAVLYHGTFTINSLAHMFGRRRFRTKDDSRNNLFLALITLGEGWHNNHHYYPGAARQGFYWWEIDITWYILLAMQRVGLVWDVNVVPERVLAAGQRKQSASDSEHR